MDQVAEHQNPADDDRVAVITGAGSPTGIGAACARALASTHRVLVAATSSRIHERVDELRGLGADAAGFIGDLTSSTAADDLIGLALERWGRVDALVNSAGMLAVTGEEAQSSAEETTDEQWRQVATSTPTST